MAKRNRKKKEVEVDITEAAEAMLEPNQAAQAMIDSPPPVEPDNFQGDEVRGAAPMEELREVDVAELAAEADVEEDNAKPNSVVHVKFKQKYLDNARALGIPGKAAKRSNWDWLAQQIAAQCLDGKHKISISCFLELLDANGVDHSRWTNRSKGWEGRLRMTGRVALQKIVANANALVLLDGTTATPPEDWAAKYRDKE
jgi:hypothetical protein